MDHDLFQIRRREREAGGQRGVLFAEKRFELALVAARADARGPQRGCTRRVAALQQPAMDLSRDKNAEEMKWSPLEMGAAMQAHGA